jgi:hypothetical protein
MFANTAIVNLAVLPNTGSNVRYIGFSYERATAGVAGGTAGTLNFTNLWALPPAGWTGTEVNIVNAELGYSVIVTRAATSATPPVIYVSNVAWGIVGTNATTEAGTRVQFSRNPGGIAMRTTGDAGVATNPLYTAGVRSRASNDHWRVQNLLMFDLDAERGAFNVSVVGPQPSVIAGRRLGFYNAGNNNHSNARRIRIAEDIPQSMLRSVDTIQFRLPQDYVTFADLGAEGFRWTGRRAASISNQAMDNQVTVGTTATTFGPAPISAPTRATNGNTISMVTAIAPSEAATTNLRWMDFEFILDVDPRFASETIIIEVVLPDGAVIEVEYATVRPMVEISEVTPVRIEAQGIIPWVRPMVLPTVTVTEIGNNYFAVEGASAQIDYRIVPAINGVLNPALGATYGFTAGTAQTGRAGAQGTQSALTTENADHRLTFENRTGAIDAATISGVMVASGMVMEGLEFWLLLGGTALGVTDANFLSTPYRVLLATVDGVPVVGENEGPEANQPAETGVVTTFNIATATASNNAPIFAEHNGQTWVNLRGLVESFANYYVTWSAAAGATWQANHFTTGELTVIRILNDGSVMVIMGGETQPSAFFNFTNIGGSWFAPLSDFGTLFGLLPVVEGGQLNLIG